MITWRRIVSVITAFLHGRLGLEFIVVSTLILFWAVALLTVYMLGLRGYVRMRLAYRNARRRYFHHGIELALAEADHDQITAALRPVLPGDSRIAQEVVVEAMRHLEGAPFVALRNAIVELGFVEQNLRDLHSPRRHRRGQAMDRLGVYRDEESAPALLEALANESLDLKLVALRALAAIGNPAFLPRFQQEALRLPPPLVPRLLSLMFEFGDPGKLAVSSFLRENPRLLASASIRASLQLIGVDVEKLV